jgi:hypothetical protein
MRLTSFTIPINIFVTLNKNILYQQKYKSQKKNTQIYEKEEATDEYIRRGERERERKR